MKDISYTLSWSLSCQLLLTIYSRDIYNIDTFLFLLSSIPGLLWRTIQNCGGQPSYEEWNQVVWIQESAHIDGWWRANGWLDRYWISKHEITNVSKKCLFLVPLLLESISFSKRFVLTLFVSSLCSYNWSIVHKNLS